MDPAQLSDSANLLLSATGVLTPVSQVLTIAVDKDSDEVETLPQSVQHDPQISVTVGVPEVKVEESVTSLPELGDREQLTTMLADNGKSLKTFETETFTTKANEKTITALAESQSAMAADNLQYVIVRVKASEPVGLVRKLVADSINVPLNKSAVFYRDVQVSKVSIIVMLCA